MRWGRGRGEGRALRARPARARTRLPWWFQFVVVPVTRARFVRVFLALRVFSNRGSTRARTRRDPDARRRLRDGIARGAGSGPTGAGCGYAGPAYPPAAAFLTPGVWAGVGGARVGRPFSPCPLPVDCCSRWHSGRGVGVTQRRHGHPLARAPRPALQFGFVPGPAPSAGHSCPSGRAGAARAHVLAPPPRPACRGRAWLQLVGGCAAPGGCVSASPAPGPRSERVL